MFTRSRTPKGLIFTLILSSLGWRAHHARAQTCNCSCDASIPTTLDVAAAFMNEGPGGPTAYVTAGRSTPCQNTEIRHANQISFGGGARITHFCVNLKYPAGIAGDTAYAFIAYLDPANQNLPGTVMHETPFTVNVNGGHQIVQLTSPVNVTGTLWAGVRYPSARCAITHQGVGPRNQGRAAIYIQGGGGWRDYDNTGSGAYTGKAPLIRPLSLIPAGGGGGGGGGGYLGCQVIATYQTNAAGLLETTEPGASTVVSVRLSKQPTHIVSVQPFCTIPAEATTGGVALTFDPFNWAIPQTFVVQGVDDPFPDGPINYRVTFMVFSVDACYDRIPVPAINCVNLDDETGGTACAGVWSSVVPFGMVPAPLSDPAMAYDSNRSVAVLFAGQPGAAGPGETWEYDGSFWNLVTMTGPSNRNGHAMVFDSFRNVVVLMGGTDSTGIQLADTWEWDGKTWTQRSTGLPNAPGGPRVDHAMAFDATRGVTVLFGGDPLLGPNQTWEWNGVTWVAKATATTPIRRSNHVMTYDARRQRVILFSGFLNNPPFVENEVWEYNGANWVQVITVGGKPAARTDAALVHDPIRGVSILYGGNVGGVNQGDVWEWDGVARMWSPIAPIPPQPSPRNRHAMVYDIPRRVAMVFGGDNGGGVGWMSDTWLYSPAGPVGPVLSRNFLVRGFGSGLPYSWGLVLQNLNYFTIQQGGFIPGLPAPGIVSALATSINTTACGQVQAVSHPLAASILTLSTTSPLTYGLAVGAAGGLPGCLATSQSLCTFNPSIIEIYLDGVDCNHNGLDDILDIANDEALDANGNFVLDSCEVATTGDLNCDNLVNVLDVQDFVLALIDPAAYALLHPECSVLRADANIDGQIDGRDVAAFVRLLGM